MKLNRLDSTTQHLSQDVAAERSRHAPNESVRRVEAPEGLDGDRQRTMQQEIAEFDRRALGPFQGGERVRRVAHELAEQLSHLGSKANSLLKRQPTNRHLAGIDDQA